jgi:hypothetical protein
MKTLLGSIAFLGLGVALLMQGCASQIPPVAAMVTANPGAAALPSDYISNFENGSVYINANLLGYPNPNASSVTQLVTNGGGGGSSSSFSPGFWSVATYGGPGGSNTVNSPIVIANAVPDATDSSNFAVHLGLAAGPITCIAVGGYESDQLTCKLENSATIPYYDATPFTGISFYYNIRPDDTSTYRQFQVATINTTAAFNHFHFLLPNGSSGGWQAVTLTWSQLTYPGFGPNSGAITTTGLTGNLNHFAFLQWQWSDNAQGSLGAPVTNLTDFWIDNVKFTP